MFSTKNVWSLYDSVSQYFAKWKLPQAVTQWLEESRPVKAAKLFWQSDLSRDNILKLAGKLNTTHYQAAKGLYDDYHQFITQSKTVHRDVKLKKIEKLAYALSQRKAELSQREKKQLDFLLHQLEQQENDIRSKTFQLANKLIIEIMQNHSLPILDNLEKILEAIKITYQKEVELDIDEVIFLVRSKIHLLDADKEMDKKKIITYLIPVYKEDNRLKKRSEEFTGENLVSVKCEQLKFLFSECRQLSWQLYFVDDESPTVKKRSIALIKEKVERGKEFTDIRQQIHCLGFENLQNQIACYSDKQLNVLTPEEFSERSIKGGAIHCALRYLSGITAQGDEINSHPKTDIILMSDADLSTNLGITGRVIWESLVNNVPMAIGSRRLPGSVVIGKSGERHLLSFGFNFLAHALLNVQVSDTQVGCKTIAPSAVRDIHERFHDLGMSFDVEMIRALQDKQLKIVSLPTYWRDSPFESKSIDQGKNMFAGLISIFQHIYSNESTQPVHYAAMTDQVSFESLASKLMAEPEFAALMSLAKNDKFHFLVHFSSEIYSILTPKTWRNFINHFSLFLCELAEGNLKQDTINLLFDDLQALYLEARQTPAVEFFMHEFPEIFSITSLLFKNREYAQVIAPLLFGDRIVGRLFSKLHYRDLIEWKNEEKTDIDRLPDREIFSNWLKSGVRKQALPPTERENTVINYARQTEGLQRLKKVSDQLTASKKITIVMQYDMDKTSSTYVDSVIKEKMKIISSSMKTHQINNLQIEMLIVDARLEKQSNIDSYIDSVLSEACVESVVTGRQVKLSIAPFGKGKANAIRFGLNEACNNKADIIGFIDFSNKIPVLEMAHLLADIIEQQLAGKPSAVIGSRRLVQSDVVNKPLTFLLRSMGLNLLVKSLFPELFHISDTQTGFKFMSSDAWQMVSDKLKCESLAFDVEILSLLSKMGCVIKEQPVTFNDNNLDSTELAGPAHEMLPDLLRLKARTQKINTMKASIEAPIRIAAGAEHTVYDLGDGSLLKIPTQFADPDFMIILKNFIFNKTEDLALKERDTGLFISQFNHILTSKYLNTYVPLLRDIADINIFVMRMISSFENKTKSFDLNKVLQYGKNLVGPFEFCQDFSVKLNNKIETFDHRHQVKRSVKALKVFKDKFFETLSNHHKADMSALEMEQCYSEVYQILDEAVALFENMWRRGLFDLDTNILSDIGYFETAEGLKLMSLDPGEMTDDLSIINVDTAIHLLDKRSDVLLMKTQLSAFPNIDSDQIIQYYLNRMKNFIEKIRLDKQKISAQREFGSDLRNNPGADFAIKCHFDVSLPKPKNLNVSYTQDDISHFLSAGYQLPYTAQPLMHLPALLHSDETVHILVNNENQYHAPSFAKVTETERGSILPLCHFIESNHLLNCVGNVCILLDAGSGTRSSLLGMQAGSKGQIQLGKNPLNTYTAQWIQIISDSLSQQGMNDYVVIASCDDLFSTDQAYIDRLIHYFKLEESPGLFWTDLPESGKNHMPLTTSDTVSFMNSHFVRDKVNHFFEAIPFTEGYAQADVVTKTMDGMMHLYRHYQHWQPSPQQSMQPSSANISLPGLSEAADRYMKLLQWYGLSTAEGGLKKPFLMVMKKSFLKDFIKILLPLLSCYIKTHITWENLLLRGLKADRTVWDMLGKPPQLSEKKWNKIYDAIQQLKYLHHIDTTSSCQNQLRAVAPTWQSLDDPYAIMKTVERFYRDQEAYVVNRGFCSLVSDLPIDKTRIPILISENNTVMIAMNSSLQGTIHPKYPDGIVATHKTTEHVLLSGVTLATNEKLYPIPGHVVVEIEGERYSTSLIPTTKANLKNQPVYHYNRETGIPDANPVVNKLSQFQQWQADKKDEIVRMRCR